MCLSTLKQNGDGNGEGEASRAQEKANLSASPPVPSSGPGSESKLSSSDVAERTVTPASLSAGSVATTASPPQSPASVPNRTSSEDGFVSTPEMKRESHDVSMKPEEGEEARVERADHLSLNEFLITELEIYCSCLLERGSLEIGSSDVSGLARITGLQLYQDHHRALMDFDDEWKRLVHGLS
ncbi:unnamed protein product [Phytophthora lilii]|uniref:Unnamed protein product n=1 Tax=Phytophthora lilii TaxID=2077276 RepID=A0A9W6THC2_9STRA|nr:unnamed protein product [Phytophthora lilii]